MRFITVILTLFLTHSINAQESLFKLGARIDIGNPTQGFGFELDYFYFFSDKTQLSLSYEFLFKTKKIGVSKRGLEHQCHLNIFRSIGTRWSRQSNFYLNDLDLLQNSQSIGIQYSYYLDQTQSSQGTGSIIYRLKGVQIYSENDLFGNLSGMDKFRTGTIGIRYAYLDKLYGIKSVMFTGETRCAGMNRIVDDNYPSRYGYKDISSCKYSNCSHGILAFEFFQSLNYRQHLRFQFGIDAEQIRNILQNRIMHDMYFVPSFINSAKNPHIPMVDKNGDLYLYKEGQVIKPWSWVYNLSLNGSSNY